MPSTLDRYFEKLETLRERQPRRFSFDITEKAFTPASVMLLLWPEDGDLSLLLTERPTSLRSHSGQISFPGGKQEPTDDDPIETAIRETAEEVGVGIDRGEVVGQLDDAWSVSRRVVYPFVSVVPERPRFTPNPAEVSTILEGRVSELLAPDALHVRSLTFEGIDFEDQTYRVGGKLVWGLTSDILTEFLDWLRDTPDPGHRAAKREEELRLFLERYPHAGILRRG